MKTRNSPRRVDLASIMARPQEMNVPARRAKMSGGEFYFTFPDETIREHRKSFDDWDASD
ncbi:hypothetical protein [Shinella zoogloeoides]|uniref:hypothetical protein n=1 Tax=Shinella zoogloeoides TaxID=352475 RepID=UPI00147867E1|nr:hypothetical protein [Shinella zoogloeoides]UEX83778.1 hypothetical protein K8M09_11325 [Shinella zoogloeoides]